MVISYAVTFSFQMAFIDLLTYSEFHICTYAEVDTVKSIIAAAATIFFKSLLLRLLFESGCYFSAALITILGQNVSKINTFYSKTR